VSDAPPGYSEVRLDGATVVVRDTHLHAIHAAMADGSLYEYAAHHADARPLAGRGVAYAVTLPDAETRVIVRHARHGGLLGGLRGDLFFGDTRAPRELDVSLRLARLGVPTPEVIAYATYPALPLMRRADVATREVPASRDLDRALCDATSDDEKAELIVATADLLRRLHDAGARHPDLNIKNVLITEPEDHAFEAWVIDVDRVWFAEPESAEVRDANFRRLVRSARKRRRLNGTPFEESDLETLADLVGATLPPSRDSE
jgi:hypothetical protein